MLKKVIYTILIVIMAIILFIAGVILINSIVKPNEVPSFFGWKPFIVLSGSMETEIYAGDIAVVKEVDADTIKEGDIIAFRYGETVITHRVVDIKEIDGNKELYTKGDNNNEIDQNTVSLSQVEGIYKFKISGLGNVAMFIQTPTGILACLSIPLALLIILQIINSVQDKKYRIQEEQNNEKLQKELERLRKENKELNNK